MSKKTEIFADGIGQIHFIGGMIRYDFVSQIPGGETSAPEEVVRVVMPPQGFLSAFSSMQQLIEKLADASVLKKSEESAPAEKKKK